jgi:lipopolysaccharide export system protein LptA
MQKFLLSILSLLLFCFLIKAGFPQERTQIKILNSNSLETSKRMGAMLRRLIGNVELQHEDIFIYCDSAYLYDDKNLVEAYNNVHIKQGDTLHLYSDYLQYKGDLKLAEFRRNVHMIDKETELYTEFLDYDVNKDLGYYFNRGKIYNGENTLESKLGYYYANQKVFLFSDSVRIINPDYTIYSDTLKYNTVSEVSFFQGPTEIISDSAYIYCENGWYNTKTDVSQFNKNAYLISKEQTVRGDSLYYDKKNGFGKAFENVELIDTIQNVILKGNYAEYYEEPEKTLITDSALFIQITSGDSLFVHADTLRSKMDSTNTHKIFYAYYKVKMYKTDFQGKCDSMSYSFRDSVIQLHGEPVLWAEENQLTSEYIEIYTKQNKIDYLKMYRSAFIVSQEDSIRFNQIKGKNMTGHFKNGELYKIDVKGNGQTIYFPKDENELIGVNQAESSDITIHIVDNNIVKITFFTNPEGILSPLDEVSESDLKFQDFKWLDKSRPKSINAIFEWN